VAGTAERKAGSPVGAITPKVGGSQTPGNEGSDKRLVRSRSYKMIIPKDGDADLLTVLSRLSSDYAKLAGVFTPLSSPPVTL
jgi:hypothetical protein